MRLRTSGLASTSLKASLSLATALFRLIFFQIQRFVPRPIARVPVVIIGTGEDAASLTERIRRFGHATYEVKGFIRGSQRNEPDAVPQDRILGDVADFARLVKYRPPEELTHLARWLETCRARPAAAAGM